MDKADLDILYGLAGAEHSLWHPLIATQSTYEDVQTTYSDLPPSWSPQQYCPDDWTSSFNNIFAPIQMAAEQVRPLPPTPSTSFSDSANNIDRKSRRRQQNRQAQRAYRTRQIELLHDLQVEIAQWRDRHDGLRDEIKSREEDISQLQNHVTELEDKLRALLSERPTMSPMSSSSSISEPDSPHTPASSGSSVSSQW